MVVVASFGGGVNSTAMLIGMVERGETCDHILFADTGGEKPHTDAHVLEFSEWLVTHGMPAITTVRKADLTLEQDCLNRKALPSVAYGFKSCSDHFKMRPQHAYLKSIGVITHIGDILMWLKSLIGWSSITIVVATALTVLGYLFDKWRAK